MRAITFLLLALLALVATACMDQRRPFDHRGITRTEAAVVAKAEQMWADEGMPAIGEKCRRFRSGLRVVQTQSDAEWVEMTGVCPPIEDDAEYEAFSDAHDCAGRAYSMLRLARVGIWPVAEADPIVIVHPDADLRGAVAHEWLHALEECAGDGRDRLHRSDALWGSGGLYERLQRWALHEMERGP